MSRKIKVYYILEECNNLSQKGTAACYLHIYSTWGNRFE